MANASEATVIFLQSHPAWIAAQQRDHQLEEEMRRHPAFWVGNALPNEVPKSPSAPET